MATDPEGSVTRLDRRPGRRRERTPPRRSGSATSTASSAWRAPGSAAPRGVADEEDVALSAFDSFCRRAARGPVPPARATATTSGGCWSSITVRKAIDLGPREAPPAAAAAGWSARRPSREQARGGPGSSWSLSQEPTPEFAAWWPTSAGACSTACGDDELRTVAVWKMEG